MRGPWSPTVLISPLADVSLETAIRHNTRIWAFASVTGGAQVGERCTVGQGVHIGPDVRIGNGCKIQNGAQLFEGVTLEDDVFIGPHVVFTNVTNPRAFISRRTEFKPTLVRRGASIGANATILCGVTIGEYAMIGAGTVVTRDVRAHSLVVGDPARHIGWVCRCGVRGQLDRENPALGPPRTGRALCTQCKTILVATYNVYYPYEAETVKVDDATVP